MKALSPPGFITYLVVALLLCSSSLFAEYQQSPAPKWVLKNHYDASKDISVKQPLQVLLYDTQVNIANGYEKYQHYVSKPLTTTGVEDISKIQIRYNPAYQKLLLHRVEVIRKGKARQALDLNKIRLLQQEDDFDSDIYMGLNTAVLLIEDVRIGDIVNYSYTISGFNPVFNEQIFGYFALDWGSVVDKRSARLLVDKNDTVYVRSHNSKHKMQRAILGGLQEYSLTIKDTVAVKNEGDYPYHYSPYSWIAFSHYENWAGVKTWANAMYSNVPKKSQKLDQLVKDLWEKTGNKKDYINAALAFVQNDVRYVGIELGENSHKPHSPEEVITKRYGDCKDKSLLLSELLQAKGVTAYSALVSTSFRDGINTELPSPGAFNHVINKVEFDGKNYWLDGTKTYQAGSLDDLGISDYGMALVIDKSKDGLVDMFTKSPFIYSMHMDESIHVEIFDKPVIYKIKTEYHGASADYQRYRFLNNSADEISKTFIEFYKDFYDGIELSKALEIKDNKENNTFTIVEEYKINDFFQREKSTLYSKLYTLAFVDALSKPKVTQDRKGPYFFGHPEKITNSIAIYYPEEIDIGFDSEEGGFSNEAFDYQYTDKYQDGVYRFNATLEVNGKPIEPENLDAYLKLLAKVKDSWVYNFKFTDPALSEGYRALIKLKKRLKDLINEI